MGCSRGTNAVVLEGNPQVPTTYSKGTHEVLTGPSTSTHVVLEEYTHPCASLRGDGLRDRTHRRPCADARAAMDRPSGPV
jgi:hypothetical protein